MDKYLISGINIKSKSGVGQLLERLHKIAIQYNYKTIYKPSGKKISRKILIRNRKYLLLIWEQLFRISYSLRLIIFKLRLLYIGNSNVLLIHPQSIGYPSFFRLIKRNKVSVYVMDNSFFCVRSRNYRLSKGECLDCLGNLENCHYSCYPYPIKYKKNDNLKYLKEYLNLSSNIIFYAQNQNQRNLLINHFDKIKTPMIVGMNTGEINLNHNKEINSASKNKDWPDFVYHGDINYSKGIKYVIDLAQELLDYNFLIPDSRRLVEEYLQEEVLNKNILFEKLRWDSGLKQYIENSKITICPSLWSAPIEGALLKSLAYSPLVAVVKTQYGFSNELDDDFILKLDKDPKIAAKTMKKAVIDKTVIDKNRINDFLLEFLQESDNKTKLIFEK